MKYIKMLGLLAVAAAALMAFAGPASATLRNSTSGTALANGTAVKATAGTTYLTGPWSDVSCTHSVVEGSLTANNANHAAGSISKLAFSNCSDEVTVKKEGTLTLENTTLKSFNAEIIVHTSVGECVFATGTVGVIVGMLEDTHVTGGTARLNINNSKIPVTGGGFFCSWEETIYGEWEGSYTISTPDPLYED